MIPCNTTLPIAKVQEFTNFKDGQTDMTFHIVQGEREMVNDCRSLARFTLRGIPPLAAGGAHIRVVCQIDADGLLSISAVEKSTGVRSSIQVKPSYGLTDEEITNMITDSITNAQDDMDMVERRLAEQKVKAVQVIERLMAALKQDAYLLNKEEKAAIDNAVTKIDNAVTKLVNCTQESSSPVAIENAIKQLDKQTQDFAARRMDISIRQALSGHSVDEI